MSRRVLPVLLLLSVYMLAAIAAVDAQEIETGYVEVTGDLQFSGRVSVRFGAVSSFPSGHSFIAFGEEENLPQLFHLALTSRWSPEPDPATVKYLLDQGVEETILGAYFSLFDYETQLMLLIPQEEVLAATLAGQQLDIEEMESMIPANVVADLQRLQEARAGDFESYQALVTVLEVVAPGLVAKSSGTGVVHYRSEEEMETAHFSGSFRGAFQGAAGSGELEGEFFAVPYVLPNQDGFVSKVERWDLDGEEPAASYCTELWDTYYPVSRFSVRASKPLADLSHKLTVELLGENGAWQTVYEKQMQPEPGQPASDRPTYDIELPEPVKAAGIRFTLFGLPFIGENWDLRVYTAPVRHSGGKMYHEWRYIHGW